ncbi:MAG: polyamine aminopropyltransferase [Lysobacterales bacterium]|jgi:spermidine synthase|nr:MAG: polyamine aminopropyltransferase [Xanthomonadales bacterium]
MLDPREWFTEIDERSGSALSYRILDKLHEEQTPFQRIAIYETRDWGRLMSIDGCVMLTSRDNFLYHEAMAHIPLFTHTAPRRVVIIGGGDCGTLREVLKHPEVERVVQVEIDERVTRLAEKHFPELCESNGDPRAELLFADGIRWMAEAKAESADVIIVDSTDPVGPAEGLFNEAFYRQCLRVLAPGGLFVQQSESPIAHTGLILSIHRHLRAAGFPLTRSACFPQPCYPSGWWSLTMAAREAQDLTRFREDAARSRPFPTRWYNAEVHRGALALPEFLREALAAI